MNELTYFIPASLFILQFVLILGGVYAFVLNREGKVIQKIEEMHKEQDSRIRETEQEAKKIRQNYVVEFADVRSKIGEGEVKTIKAINDLERALREAIHGLRQDMQKWVSK